MRLGQWIGTEVRSTRAAAVRRQVLALGSRYQDAAFSLALAHPSPAGATFAADLALKWKKRLAQDDAILNNIARETPDPRLLAAVRSVGDGRRALSSVAFDPKVAPEERTRLQEALEAAEAELRAQSAVFDRYQRASGADSDEVALSLAPDAALVEYRLFDPFDFETSSFGPTRLLAVVLRADAAPALVDLGEAGLFTPMQALVGSRDLRVEQDIGFDQIMRLGYHRLIAPLEPYLAGIGTLYLAPDGPLQALPFAAFLDGDGRRLIETRRLRLLQTGRDLVTRDRPAGGKGSVGFGGIDFNAGLEVAQAAAPPAPDEEGIALQRAAAAFTAFAPLDATGDEVEHIAATYAALLPDEPSPKVFTGAAREPPAGVAPRHARLLPRERQHRGPSAAAGWHRPRRRQCRAQGRGWAGRRERPACLQGQTLNLFGTELVVLSACDTGKGTYDYSEGLEGLPRAFYVAGARNVLVALWPVGDQAARRFMERFYDIWLAQTQGDPAQALRQTQLGYLTSTDTADKDPANWAPFVLIEG